MPNMCAHVCTCVHMYTWPSHVFPCTPDHFPGPKCRFLVFKWCQHVPTHVYTCTPDLFPGLNPVPFMSLFGHAVFNYNPPKHSREVWWFFELMVITLEHMKGTGLKEGFTFISPRPPWTSQSAVPPGASCYKKPPPNTFVRRFFRNFSSGFEIHSIDWTNFRFFSRKSTLNTFGQRIFDLYFFLF